MRKLPLLLAVVLLLSLIPVGLAASWIEQDEWTTTLDLSGVAGTLTITPGAGGWVDGGYNFDGSATYATRTSFRPLHNVHAFTVIIWLRPDVAPPSSTDDIMLGQYVDANHRIQLVSSVSNYLSATAGNGSTNVGVTTGAVSAGGLYCLIVAWNGSLNAGKIDAYLNNTLTTSANGITGNTSAAADLMLGRLSASGYYFDGKIYQLAIYDRKLSAEESRQAHAGGASSVYDSPVWWWRMDEASGIALLPNAGGWFGQDGWSESLIASAPYTPGWQGQDYWAESLPVAAPVVDYSPFLPPWVSLLGMILLPVSLCYVPLKKRLNDEIRFDDLGMAALLFFLGLALMIGSVV